MGKRKWFVEANDCPGGCLPKVLAMICANCSSSNFRLSRLRWKDVERLALLQYPIRCRNCHERTYGGFVLALYMAQSRRARRRKRVIETR